jgi:WD40 repeat protein
VVHLNFDAATPLKYKEISEEKVHSKRVMGIWSDTKRKLIYSIGEDGMLKVFDLTASKVTQECQVATSKLTCVVANENSGIAFIGDVNGTVNVYDFASVRILKN